MRSLVFSRRGLLFHLAWLFCHVVKAQEDLTFAPNCSIDEYYRDIQDRNGPSSWTRSELELLLNATHHSVPYNEKGRDKEDIQVALMDIEWNVSWYNHHLIYRDLDVISWEFGKYLDLGENQNWDPEHLWPQSRGLGDDSGPAFSDLHALRPADETVRAARGNLFFGDCHPNCTNIPASPEAASDTAKNETVFLPPASIRGDIARALFYMELRYSSTSFLELTDCPDGGSTQMGYLSELLQWHEDDPVDDEENIRNDRICARWQGNRNIFIDYPELATIFYGDPAQRPYQCLAETAQPTPPPTTDSPLATASPSSIEGDDTRNPTVSPSVGNNVVFTLAPTKAVPQSPTAPPTDGTPTDVDPASVGSNGNFVNETIDKGLSPGGIAGLVLGSVFLVCLACIGSNLAVAPDAESPTEEPGSA